MPSVKSCCEGQRETEEEEEGGAKGVRIMVKEMEETRRGTGPDGRRRVKDIEGRGEWEG